MVNLQSTIRIEDFHSSLHNLFLAAKDKITSLNRDYDESKKSPVYTVKGKYTTRGWTEWTEGFRYGIPILHFDATGDQKSLETGRRGTLEKMAKHVSHTGVHDHGFNNISTFGNLHRLMLEGRIEEDEWERRFYELALKISGAVQASRWTVRQGGGFIYSFNGPHSLFVDTIRSCRILMLAHHLGHLLMGEGEKRISLLERALQHIESTALFSVYYGEGRDRFDVRGRTAHESIFNVNNGTYRCPGTQQGYSGFTTWTRGQSWACLGFAEELEMLDYLDENEFEPFGGKRKWEQLMVKAATAVADNFIENTPADGICYWDQGAPDLTKIADHLRRPADPFNPYEPVDSTASAITAQGLFRLANWMRKRGKKAEAERYEKAALVTSKTLFDEPYLSLDPEHQGLLLHSIYHEPNGWDYRPEPGKVACGESSMWGDYHLMELAVFLQRILKKEPYYTYFQQ